MHVWEFTRSDNLIVFRFGGIRNSSVHVDRPEGFDLPRYDTYFAIIVSVNTLDTSGILPTVEFDGRMC